jgi:hypothetical protein
MRHLLGRRALSFDFLPAEWINVGSPCFRIIRHPPRYIRSDLLLYPAFSDQRAVCGHGSPRLYPFSSRRARLRVSSTTTLDMLRED